jgi:energy-coupling factor transport system permease protein
MVTSAKHSDTAVEVLLSARVKVVLVVCFSVAVLLIDNVQTLAAAYATLMPAILLAKPGRRKLFYYALFSLAAVWGFLLTQSIFYAQQPRTVLFVLVSRDAPLIGPLTGGISVYLEGAIYGAVQSLRFLAMMTAGLALVWTTSPQELLQALRRLRLPYKAAFMVAAALRFIPAIASEARATLAAMRSRGYPMRPSRPWRYLTALTAGLGPILFRNMRRAAMLADSVESRGFALRADDGQSPIGRASAIERIALWLAPTIVLSMIAAKLITAAALYGVFYNEGIGWVYGLVKAFM